MSPFFAVVEGEGEESINESCGVLFRNGRLGFPSPPSLSSFPSLSNGQKHALAMGSGYEVVTQAALHAAPSLFLPLRPTLLPGSVYTTQDYHM